MRTAFAKGCSDIVDVSYQHGRGLVKGFGEPADLIFHFNGYFRVQVPFRHFVTVIFFINKVDITILL